MNGGNGADRIDGGLGSDILRGGGGADTFVYRNAAEGEDVVTDFAPGALGDVLDIREVLDSASGYDGTNALSGGYLQFISNGAGGTLVQVDSDGGANSFVTLANLTSALLTQTDTANYIV